jgi:hypothetical protein
MLSFLVRDPARQHADRMTTDLGGNTGSAVSLKSLDRGNHLLGREDSFSIPCSDFLDSGYRFLDS